MSDFLREVGRRIQDRRQSAGLKQGELADKVGSTQTTISGVENGKQDFSVTLLSKVARALGTRSSNLLGEEETAALPAPTAAEALDVLARAIGAPVRPAAAPGLPRSPLLDEVLEVAAALEPEELEEYLRQMRYRAEKSGKLSDKAKREA